MEEIRCYCQGLVYQLFTFCKVLVMKFDFLVNNLYI